MFTNKLTQVDILSTLPIPPVGTMWKIWVGKSYINKKSIGYWSAPEEYPFVLGLLKNDNSPTDGILGKKGILRLTKRSVKTTAMDTLRTVVARYPTYSIIQPENSKLNKKSHLLGYYADKNELTR